jgi:hypothetical protein
MACCSAGFRPGQAPLWVIRYRSLRAENRSMSAVPRKRRKVSALASVAKGRGSRCGAPGTSRYGCAVCRSITGATLAFECGFPAITLDAHLQDRGMVHEKSCPTVDLPRFGGQLRAWDQSIWSDGILPSCLVSFFCSAPGGAILPSRPVARSGGQGRPHLGAARRACP